MQIQDIYECGHLSCLFHYNISLQFVLFLLHFNVDWLINVFSFITDIFFDDLSCLVEHNSSRYCYIKDVLNVVDITANHYIHELYVVLFIISSYFLISAIYIKSPWRINSLDKLWVVIQMKYNCLQFLVRRSWIEVELIVFCEIVWEKYATRKNQHHQKKRPSYTSLESICKISLNTYLEMFFSVITISRLNTKFENVCLMIINKVTCFLHSNLGNICNMWRIVRAIKHQFRFI